MSTAPSSPVARATRCSHRRIGSRLLFVHPGDPSLFNGPMKAGRTRNSPSELHPRAANEEAAYLRWIYYHHGTRRFKEQTSVWTASWPSTFPTKSVTAAMQLILRRSSYSHSNPILSNFPSPQRRTYYKATPRTITLHDNTKGNCNGDFYIV